MNLVTNSQGKGRREGQAGDELEETAGHIQSLSSSCVDWDPLSEQKQAVVVGLCWLVFLLPLNVLQQLLTVGNQRRLRLQRKTFLTVERIFRLKYVL